MGGTGSLDERAAALGARIAAAEARLRAREGGGDETIGAALGAINDDLDLAAHKDHDEATQLLNKIEARIRAEEIRLEDDREDEEEG